MVPRSLHGPPGKGWPAPSLARGRRAPPRGLGRSPGGSRSCGVSFALVFHSHCCFSFPLSPSRVHLVQVLLTWQAPRVAGAASVPAGALCALHVWCVRVTASVPVTVRARTAVHVPLPS